MNLQKDWGLFLMMKMNEKIIKKEAFNFMLLLAAVLVNCLGSFIARNISIPLYLDSLLTISVVALCGLWWGLACAVISNVTLYFFDYSMLPFTLCHMLTALLAYITFWNYKKRLNLQTKNVSNEFPGSRNGTNKKELLIPLETFLWAGLWSGISNAVSGNLISDFLFGANTGVDNIDTAVRSIYLAIGNLRLAIYLGGLITNLTDKALSAVLSFVVYGFISKYKK